VLPTKGKPEHGSQPDSGPPSEKKFDPEIDHEHCSSGSTFIPPAVDLYIPPYHCYGGAIVPARPLYPISRDHLMPLVEYNVFRATATNFLILGRSRFSGTACPFGASVPTFPNPYEGVTIPASLEQTSLQKSTQYPVWIDLLPSPRMRDNAIRSLHLFTSNELYADLLGSLMGKQNDVDSILIAWSDPWTADGWELTEGFLRKWEFLVRGCTDLFQATNRWRSTRGEEPLIFELE